MADTKIPDGTIRAVRYGTRRGPVPPAIMDELRRSSKFSNDCVEAEIRREKKHAEIWRDDPECAPYMLQLDAAEAGVDAAQAALKQQKQRLGYARKTGHSERITTATAKVEEARALAQAAKGVLQDARLALSTVMSTRKHVVKPALEAANEQRDKLLSQVKRAYIETGGYWANAADTADGHGRRMKAIYAARRKHRYAPLRFGRFDGTGSVTVQIQREEGVLNSERRHLARLRALGLEPRQISLVLAASLTEHGLSAILVAAAFGAWDKDPLAAAAALAKIREQEGRTWKPQTIARMREEEQEKEKEPDPLCDGASLADPGGKWRSQLRLAPALPENFAELTRAEQKAIARTGVMAIRTGSGEHKATSEIPVTIHRRLPPKADVKYARATVERLGPDLLMFASFQVRVPAPPPQAGRTVCMHTGWRALPDGSLRVAVIAGAGKLPAGLAAAAAAGQEKMNGTLVRQQGFWELRIPAAWRDESEKIAKLRSRRDLDRDALREQVAVWLEQHPGMLGGENVPSPAEVRQWRDGRRLVHLGRDCREGMRGAAAAELGDLIMAWHDRDIPAWRTEARRRQRLISRRNDLYAQVAAWMCRGAGEVRLDDFDMAEPARRPGPEEDDDVQAAAARANKVLAAPATLRQRAVITAALAGVRVTMHKPGAGGQVHIGCGEELPAEERRRSLVVRCLRCGASVDQDANMLALMAAGR